MRIDDDSAERVQQDARAQERKLQEQQQKRRTDEATAFDKALQSRTTSANHGQVKKSFDQAQKDSAKGAIQSLLEGRKELTAEGKLEGRLEHAEVEALADDAHHQETQGDQQKLARGAAGRKEVDRKTGRMVESGRGDDQAASAGQTGRVREGQAEVQTQQVARKSDADADQHRQEGRDERAPTGAQPKAGGGANPRVGERPDKQRDGGQQQQQGGQNNPPGAFRLPPAALMAPPPVAVPKDTQPSRLRQLAQEIAEKIVKHVRVGTNRAGVPEFQLELKSDILKGLKVKVSGRHGRIRALFSSRDPQVLKQLRGEVEALRTALSARGLKVDALDIEEERS
jgi:hypothetical protein